MPPVRRCSACGETKALDAYHKRRVAGDGRAPLCKLCKARVDRLNYLRTRETRTRQSGLGRRATHGWYTALKQGPCGDCDNSFHFAAMHWDHRPGTTKLFSVSDGHRSGYSKLRLLAEIAKCDLVCANCHAIRTYQRLRDADSR